MFPSDHTKAADPEASICLDCLIDLAPEIIGIKAEAISDDIKKYVIGVVDPRHGRARVKSRFYVGDAAQQD